MKVTVFDIETDGFLEHLTVIHCLCLQEIIAGVKGPIQTFTKENMHAGLAILNSSDTIVGHNVVSFDIPAIEKVYPDWYLPDSVTIRDTLVLARMQKSNIKDSDFGAFRAGLLEGKLIGLHKLDAWGQRLGLFKGDYQKIKTAEAKELGLEGDAIRQHVWGTCNPDMLSYCAQDISVTTLLWEKLVEMKWSEEAVRLEHRIHYIMALQEQFGFQFDVEAAQELAGNLTIEYNDLREEVVSHFGKWFAPKKRYKLAPRPQFGEDESRKSWGEITTYKKVRKARETVDGTVVICEYSPDAPCCQIELKEFNPNSRPQIIDRLETIYDWEPVDFTEKGNPEVNDDVLRSLAPSIPICEDLAELFFLNKLLGMVANGDNAWLALVGTDSKIHGHVNVGGTITGRGAHSKPNTAQVPKVAAGDVIGKDGRFNKKIIDKKTGEPFAYCYDAEGKLKKKTIIYGRPGKYGFECRSLFTAPPDWWLMGSDLKGIELRCLAARLAEFDAGDYLKEVLEGDPHTRNQIAFELDSRDNAKTCLYAIMYGGGDLKIGSIVLPPSASADAMRARGKQLKGNLQRGIPAFGKLIKKIGKEAGRGYLIGLDGRKLWVRHKHAALNLQLQSDAALIAKLWVIFFFDMMGEAGYVYGEDWGLCSWVHDEIQAACRTKEIAEHAALIARQASKEAGEYFNYAAPVDADSKIGRTWAETH